MNLRVLENQLREKKIRPTAVRLRVLDYFHKHPYAASLNDLEEILSPVDRSTLFRTIRTFEEGNLLHRISEENGVIKYALCPHDCHCTFVEHLHVHFSCIRCHQTLCLESVSSEFLALPDGYIPMDVNFLIKGVCRTCAQ